MLSQKYSKGSEKLTVTEVDLLEMSTLSLQIGENSCRMENVYG